MRFRGSGRAARLYTNQYTIERAHPSPARSRNAISLTLLTMLFDHVTVQLLHPEILNDTRNHLNDYFPRPAAAALYALMA